MDIPMAEYQNLSLKSVFESIQLGIWGFSAKLTQNRPTPMILRNPNYSKERELMEIL
jgi:hypothetical protein